MERILVAGKTDEKKVVTDVKIVATEIENGKCLLQLLAA